MLIFHDRFVNFNIEPDLTDEDQKRLDTFAGYPHGFTKGPYEGDAALGWFQNNVSAYPTATAAKELSFHNVDLRHQIFTEHVNLGDFKDGDKNTALLDLDGSLTGFKVVDSDGGPTKEQFPISLNNLPINASSNAVDECLAEGEQDAELEGRPTSLISPGNMATLEFGAPWPNPSGTRHDQLITFTKDSTDYGAHQTMDLRGRDGRGIWEPKVSSGYGYTITAAVDPRAVVKTDKAGIPNFVDVGFTDAVEGVSELLICYPLKGEEKHQREGGTL